MADTGGGIIFRVDASQEIGLGHIVRCLSLALTVQGGLRGGPGKHTIDFVLRDDKAAKDVMGDSGFNRNAIWIPPDKDDVKFFGDIVKEIKPVVVVTDIDLRKKVDKYLKALYSKSAHFSLHEHNFGILTGDRVIAPTFKPLEPAKGGMIGQTHFTGPEYLILSPEIPNIRRFGTQPGDPALKVVVSAGGGDPGRNTEKVVAAIKAYNDPTIDWKVVLGPASGYDKWELTRVYPAKIGYLDGVELGRDRFLELLTNADLVITNGGTTLYEALATGRPAIAIAQNEFESEVIDILSGSGACIRPPNITAPAILETMNAFLNDGELRRSCSMKGMEAIDGLGAKRIADMIIGSLG